MTEHALLLLFFSHFRNGLNPYYQHSVIESNPVTHSNLFDGCQWFFRNKSSFDSPRDKSQSLWRYLNRSLTLSRKVNSFGSDMHNLCRLCKLLNISVEHWIIYPMIGGFAS
jgi:hypothetical protein